MLDHEYRPLVFLDVDGPLIPLRARPTTRRPPTRGVPDPAHDTSGNPLVERLDPDDGRKLLGLGCQLVWATTWMADANEVVSPRLGLPTLPVVEFPDTDDEPVPGLHWKTVSLTLWAAGRPFVWIDDETTDLDRQWISHHHPSSTLLHRVDPYAGLTDADFSTIHRWLAEQQAADNNPASRRQPGR